MKHLLVPGIAIVLLMVQGVSGLSVSTVTVSPSGDLWDGTPVTVTCEIPRTGILLYDQLVMTTDLESPVWDPEVIVRDQEKAIIPAAINGNTLTINGAVYNYPQAIPVKVRVIVKGTVPFNHTTNQRLLNIRQLDADGTEYAYPSGYTLPMPGSPPVTTSGTGTTPALPEESLLPEETLPAIRPEVTVVSLPVSVASVPGKTVSLPTPLPASTPAAAAPAGPLVVFGAIGIVAYCLRQKPGR